MNKTKPAYIVNIFATLFLIMFILGYYFNNVITLSFVLAVLSVAMPEVIFKKVVNKSYGKDPKEINGYMYLGSFSKYTSTILIITLVFFSSLSDPKLYLLFYIICKLLHVLFVSYIQTQSLKNL